MIDIISASMVKSPDPSMIWEGAILEPPKLHTLHVMESTLIDLSAWQFLRCTQKKAHRCCTCRQSQWAGAPCCRWHDTETKIYTTCTRRLSGLSHYINVIIDRSVYGMSHGDDIFPINVTVQCKLPKKYVLQFLPGRPAKSKVPRVWTSIVIQPSLALGWNLFMKKQLASKWSGFEISESTQIQQPRTLQAGWLNLISK